MSTDNMLSRGKRLVQLSLISNTSATTVSGALHGTENSPALNSTRTVDDLSHQQVLEYGLSGVEKSTDDLSSQQAVFHGVLSDEESIDSDDSGKDPSFAPRKRDLRHANLSSDEDDLLFTHCKKVKQRKEKETTETTEPYIGKLYTPGTQTTDNNVKLITLRNEENLGLNASNSKLHAPRKGHRIDINTEDLQRNIQVVPPEIEIDKEPNPIHNNTEHMAAQHDNNIEIRTVGMGDKDTERNMTPQIDNNIEIRTVVWVGDKDTEPNMTPQIDNSIQCPTVESDNTVIDHEELVVTKQRAKPGRAEPETWSRNTNKQLRMEGKAYTCASKPRKGRMVEPRKCTDQCLNPVTTRKCHIITEEDRQQMFSLFWSMTWDEKKIWVSNMIDRRTVQERSTIEPDEANYRKKYSYYYFLNKDGERVPVCKHLFLSTLCIGEKSVYKWIDKLKSDPSSVTPRRTRIKRDPIDRNSAVYLHVVNFLESLAKLPSHYCRSSTNKLYLEPVFTTFMNLYKVYSEHCRTQDKQIMNRRSFKYIFDEMNISLFKPKKDQCDTCCSFEAGNITEDEYNTHIEKKNSARDEKSKDKDAASSDDSLAVITLDLQAVLLSPLLKASAMYYKTKLACHNFTIFNLTTKGVTCYFWHEGDGDLSANSFASCVVDYICHLGRNIKTLIIYSDGCNYQNRNCTLSNALLRVAVQQNITIYQKYLEKGHTQMEADSIHSTIERQLRNKPIYCPQNYVDFIKVARNIPTPYDVKCISYDFFKDYSKLKYYTSIRPGMKVGEPVVTDLRVLKYTPGDDCRIEYKLKYGEEFQEFPRRAKVNSPSDEDIVENVNTGPLKIKSSKYHHLQELKAVLPVFYHAFYDNLLHE